MLSMYREKKKFGEVRIKKTDPAFTDERDSGTSLIQRIRIEKETNKKNLHQVYSVIVVALRRINIG